MLTHISPHTQWHTHTHSHVIKGICSHQSVQLVRSNISRWPCLRVVGGWSVFQGRRQIGSFWKCGNTSFADCKGCMFLAVWGHEGQIAVQRSVPSTRGELADCLPRRGERKGVVVSCFENVSLFTGILVWYPESQLTWERKSPDRTLNAEKTTLKWNYPWNQIEALHSLPAVMREGICENMNQM